MLTAVDHLILAVHDLDAATALYRRLLGLAPSWTGVHPHWGTANTLFRIDNTYLELLAPGAGGAFGDTLRAWLDASGEGLIGLAFATGDIDGCVAALAARGLSPGPVEAGEGHDTTSGAERRWWRANLPLDRTRGVFLFPIQHASPPDALPMARAECEANAAVHAVDHVVVQTTDAEATRALYGEGLGLRLAVDKEFPDWGVRLMFFRVGGVTVEVAAALPASPEALPSAQPSSTDRLYGVTWRVRDIDAARARLAADGFDVSEVRTGRRPGTRVCTVRNQTCNVPTLMIGFDEARL